MYTRVLSQHYQCEAERIVTNEFGRNRNTASRLIAKIIELSEAVQSPNKLPLCCDRCQIQFSCFASKVTYLTKEA